MSAPTTTARHAARMRRAKTAAPTPVPAQVGVPAMHAAQPVARAQKEALAGPQALAARQAHRQVKTAIAAAPAAALTDSAPPSWENKAYYFATS